MQRLSSEARQLVENQTREVIQNGLMQDVQSHRTFLANTVTWVLSVTSIFIIAATSIFYFLVGNDIRDAKQSVEQEINQRLIQFRIVKENERIAQEYAKIAISNATDSLESRIEYLSDSLIQVTKVVLSDSVSEIIDNELLATIQRELKKEGRVDIVETLVRSVNRLQQEQEDLLKELRDYQENTSKRFEKGSEYYNTRYWQNRRAIEGIQVQIAIIEEDIRNIKSMLP